MAIREYKCNNCRLITERIVPASQEIPPHISCPRCHEEANYLDVPSSISLGRSSFYEAPIDVIVGKDAERRWEDIHSRQDKRDTIRANTGSVGLTMVSKDEFVPVSEQSRKKRAEAYKIMETNGVNPSYDSSEDAKLLNTQIK